MWCLQYGLYPRLQWSLMMYEVGASRVERIEQRCSVYIRKWLKLPKTINNTVLYGKKQQLTLPMPSIFEEYKAGKVRTVMMPRYSKDDKISENPPEVRTCGKWNTEDEVNEAINRLRHQNIIGLTQTVRSELGVTQFNPFPQSNAKERRDAVVKEVRQVEQESQKRR